MEKQQRHTCRLCLRRFPNGRSLGGHMRTHARADPSPSLSSNSSGSASAYVLRENPKRSFRLADPEFSSLESELESSLPKRPRNEEVASSASETTSDEDVAFCLVMLFRDVWQKEDRDPDRRDLADEDADEEELEPEQPEELRPAKGGGKFQCSTCKTCFRSYQALGGHRASHNKSKTCAPPGDDYQIRNAAPPPAQQQQRLHECPFCPKVFQSGQALGGHKRSHLLASATRRPERIIDLNLPAPAEESESFIDCSALSDADQ